MSNDTPVIGLGPFRFHLTQAMTVRLMPRLSDNPTFGEVQAALIDLSHEDRAREAMDNRLCSPRSIMAALTMMRAFNPNHVSTKVLIEALVPRMQNETEEDHMCNLNQIARALALAVKRGKLEGFHMADKWMLPAKDFTFDENPYKKS